MKKDRLINRNLNLTLEQKSEIIELLGKHPSYENKVDWNKSNSLTYEDFLKVLRPLYINELDPRNPTKKFFIPYSPMKQVWFQRPIV